MTLLLNKTFNGHHLCRTIGTPFFMSGYYEPDTWNRAGNCMFALCSGYDPNYTMRPELQGQYDTNMSTAHCTEVTGLTSGDYITDWTIPVVSTNYTSDNVNSFMSFYQYSTTTNCMWETCTFTASGVLV